jgi:hypothetical protein
MQKSIFPQKIQKSLCITTKSLHINSNFKHNYLENYNDSEGAVKTKNAPFFIIFPNISFCHMIVTDWADPLTIVFDQLPKTSPTYGTVKITIAQVRTPTVRRQC